MSRKTMFQELDVPYNQDTQKNCPRFDSPMTGGCSLIAASTVALQSILLPFLARTVLPTLFLCTKAPTFQTKQVS